MTKQYHVVICLNCMGEGLCRIPDFKGTPKEDGKTLPGVMLYKVVQCKICGGMGYLKVNVDKLKEKT